MKKTASLVLVLLFLLLASIPVSAKSAAFTANDSIHKLHFWNMLDPGDIIFERMNVTLPISGNDYWRFDYYNTDGTEIRVGVNDLQHKGMNIVVYYTEGGSLEKVLEGETNASNFYGYVGTFTPSAEGEYTIYIISKDGDGGIGYDYDVRVRGI